MKLYALLFLISFAAVNAHPHGKHDHDHDHGEYVVKTNEDLLRYRDHCSTLLNIPAELVEQYKKWQYPNDEQTQCYIKCVMEQFGFFDNDLGFDAHKIHHQLAGTSGPVDHTDATHAKIQGCVDKNPEGSGVCAWAYRNAMCFMKENLQLVQLSVKTR